MRVTVIGSGYVGTTTALVLAQLGHAVIGYDVDANKVAKLNNGLLPFTEPGLDQLLCKLLTEKRIVFTSNSRTAIAESEILVISVGTPPTPSGNADLTYIEQVIDAIAAHINEPKVVVTKSTVPIGTNRWMKRELTRKINVAKTPVEVVSNPEFLREGEALYDSLHPSRTVVGGDNEAALEKVKQLYAPLDTKYFTCNFETSEMIKYASNGFLAAKISFINEMARLAEAVGADILGVAAGMGMDPRISPHHLYAGIGYGGSCFPKDVDELLHLGRQKQVDLSLLQQAKRVNDSQIDWFVQRIELLLPLQAKRVLVLGVAFKEDTDDQRESPGIRLMERLLERGVAEIRIMDPTVSFLEQIRWNRHIHEKEKQRLHVVTDFENAADGIDAAVLTTPWKEFRNYPWNRWAKQAKSPFLFDGRNFLNPEEMRGKGWHYVGIARGESS